MKRTNRGLPLYRACRDLAAETVRHAAKSAKTLRYTFGERITDYAMQLMTDFYETYHTHEPKEKLRCITLFLHNLERLRMTMDVGHEVDFFDKKTFPLLLDRYEAVYRQASAWRDHIAEDVPARGADTEERIS